MAKDYFGDELHEGDIVIFATKTKFGKGIFLHENKSGSVSVRPTVGKDGKKLTRQRWIHSVEGRFIDPYFHIKKRSHYIVTATGKELEKTQYEEYLYPENKPRYWTNRMVNADFIPYDQRTFVHDEYYDYVREIELDGGEVVVVHNGRNVIKF